MKVTESIRHGGDLGKTEGAKGKVLKQMLEIYPDKFANIVAILGIAYLPGNKIGFYKQALIPFGLATFWAKSRLILP